MKPLLKWVGGKTQLISELTSILPSKFGSYHEPFLGGGALFFELERPGSFVSDFNPRLVSFYNEVSLDPDALFQVVQNLADEFNSKSDVEKKNHFYACRDEFNLPNLDPTRTAALFYYLNKTCFNGLFRENSKGEFNVPFGQKKLFPAFDKEQFHAASALLKTATIKHGNYSLVLDAAQPGDLVYFDPPYVPLPGSPSFTAYLSSGFGPSQQQELVDVFQTLSDRGVHVMASNSYTDTVTQLYSRYNIKPIKARRNINSNGNGRGQIDEALITNF